MIPSLVLFEHRNGQHQRKHFGADDGEPDAVNHAIDGGENHHGDGGQREAQQLAVAEMVGEGDGGHNALHKL